METDNPRFCCEKSVGNRYVISILVSDLEDCIRIRAWQSRRSGKFRAPKRQLVENATKRGSGDRANGFRRMFPHLTERERKRGNQMGLINANPRIYSEKRRVQRACPFAQAITLKEQS